MTKPKLITLYEHEHTVNYNWSEKELLAVGQMNASVGANVLNPVVRLGKKEFKATEYVGVVKFVDRAVQILPKIHRTVPGQSGEQTAREASRNLLKLLSYAGDFPFKESEMNSLLAQTDDWFEILIHLFASRLRDEWRLGASRTYQTTRGELPVLKGKWLIAEQIKQPIKRTVFLAEYDEFTANNPLNRVFRYVVERLFFITRNISNKQILGELREFLEDVDLPARVTAEDAARITLTRTNWRYATLLNLAKLFLQGHSVQLAHGALDTFSFVFDMNLLFENFIAEFIRRHKTDILTTELAASSIHTQGGGGNSLHMARSEERDYFKLKPDIIFRHENGDYPLILDTKYKSLKTDKQNLGISQDDFYQMHSYARRYESPRVVLIYPQTLQMPVPVRRLFKLYGCDVSVMIATVNMQVDLNSYADRQRLVAELKEILGEK